ncbi:MAG: hypothetical protein D4R92_04680 [Actinobacteria bacterium]|nr:MAG: hypothetical protein D4R92_04680 [Actinomycetota bacterium]
MSQRHRRVEAIPPVKQELRAHAHNERHRIHTELHLITEQVQHGVEPEDIDEPGTNWKPLHHHDSQISLGNSNGRGLKHWKTKAWKRRKALRRARAAQITAI